MAPSPAPAAKPVIIPATHTATTPPDSFSDPSQGQLTWHTLISSPATPTSDLCAGIAACPARTGHLARHRHAQAEIYHVLSGRGRVVVDGAEHAVEAGSTVFIPGDAEHAVVCDGDDELRWFYVFPTGAFADVVYRFSGAETR